MPKGISLHIGLNEIDPGHYQSRFFLPNCINDAKVMQAIADINGFNSYLMTDDEATVDNVVSALHRAAVILEENDILFVSYSGHGRTFKDLNGDEEDHLDEALMLYDRCLIDDELHKIWRLFQPGVRILFICDACHSGTIIKDFGRKLFTRWFGLINAAEEEEPDELYERHQRLYDTLLKDLPSRTKAPVACSVLLLAACQDKQVARAGRDLPDELSTFTELLITTWNEGSFIGTYKEFYHMVRKHAADRGIAQQPNYMVEGRTHSFFERQIPFTI